MTTNRSAIVFTLLLLIVVSSVPALAQKSKPLSSDQQKELLSRRLPSGAVMGTFGSFGSMIFALTNIAIHTNDKQIGETELNSPFPKFYRPTIRELFDTIATQTGSSWIYDPKDDYWVFAKPARTKPFSITLAEKWIANDRGLYVSYKPPTYPVGLDVYYFGSFSAEKRDEEADLWKQIRNFRALGFASHLKRDVTTDEMKIVTLDGAEALYFQSPAPRPGVVWQQWSLVKNGQAFVIVSSLPANDDQLLSAVESMVKSFRVDFPK